MFIAVGSQNKAKLITVQIAIQKLFPSCEVIIVSDDFSKNCENRDNNLKPNSIYIQGFNVESGVSSQPMTDDECIQGATNRATNAMKELPTAVYGIGLEGGVDKKNGKWYECGWIVVKKKIMDNSEGDEYDNIGIASSARFEISDKIMRMITEDKMELGTVMDKLSEKQSVKTNEGAMGILTNGLLSRAQVYSDAVIFAFSKFISEKKYWK